LSLDFTDIITYGSLVLQVVLGNGGCK
jgi:hypothetical protein